MGGWEKLTAEYGALRGTPTSSDGGVCPRSAIAVGGGTRVEHVAQKICATLSPAAKV